MFVKKSNRQKIMSKAVICLIAVIIGLAIYIGCLYLNNQQIIQRKKQAEITSVKSAKIALAVKEAKKKELVYITLPGAKPIKAIIEDYLSTDSIWAIVSKTHPISVDYVPPSLKIPDVLTRTDKSDEERSVRYTIETPLKEMFAAASAAGNSLMIGSGYRSAALQKVYFDSLASSVGEDTANQSIARPGQSEHQTGLAVDITASSLNCYLDDCFADTPDGKWLVANSYKYGFILRYPEDKVAITGYRYEPWHFRYVGVDLATALHESGMTLDEAWPYILKARDTLKQNDTI
jgi:D-alanyl-D-alanine carboxypeptidase